MLTTPHPESQDGRQKPFKLPEMRCSNCAPDYTCWAFGKCRKELPSTLATQAADKLDDEEFGRDGGRIKVIEKALIIDGYFAPTIAQSVNAHAALSKRVRELEERGLGLSVENSGLYDALEQCFVHLSAEIIRLPLNGSAAMGTQRLSKLIAGLLDERQALTAQRSEP